MTPEFVLGIAIPRYEGSALWFLYQGNRLLVGHDKADTQIPLIHHPTGIGLEPVRELYIGYLATEKGPLHCFCGEIDDEATAPAGYSFEGLRSLYSQLDEQLFWLAGKAVQIVDWDRTHLYCGRCGHRTVSSAHDRSKVCPTCGLTSYPRLAPAIIVRVQRLTASGPEILLARARRFPTAMYSVLAGFVEPGETLEECVEREIQEEVGIAVHNIHYFGSQPWPFPHSLMIAFTADHASGDIIADPSEISDAAWFPVDNLPNYPPPPSIANRLITFWLADSATDK